MDLIKNNNFKGAINNVYTPEYLSKVDNLINSPIGLGNFLTQMGNPNVSKDVAKTLLTDGKYGKWHNTLNNQLILKKVQPKAITDWIGDYPNWKDNGGNLSDVKLSDVLNERKVNPSAYKNFEVSRKLPTEFTDSLGNKTNYIEYNKQLKEFNKNAK